MEARLFMTTGEVERIPIVDPVHFAFHKDCLNVRLRIDEHAYRGQLVDEEYDRVVYDTDDWTRDLTVGDVVYAGRQS